MSHIGAKQHVFQGNKFTLLKLTYFSLKRRPKNINIFSNSTRKKLNLAKIFCNARV